MKTPTIACLAVCVFSSAPAYAQNVIRWTAPTAVTSKGTGFYVPQGTPLALTSRTQISSRHNKPGDRVYFEVAETVSFRGQIVVPVGALAIGEVVNAQRNGHFGRKGKIAVRLLYVETPSGPVRLTGRTSDEGKSGTAASVATMALVSGLGFLIHGTSADIAEGTSVEAYLAEPLRFTWHPQDSVGQAMVTQAVPDARREPPARFDPTVFGGNGPGFQQGGLEGGK